MPKETVLLAAGANFGKSTFLWQQIFKYIHHAEVEGYDPGPIFVLDNERKMRRIAAMFGGVPSEVTLLSTPTIPETVEAVEDIILPAFDRESQSNEGYGLICIDMVNVWWDRAQAFYVESISDGEKTMADQVMEMAKKKTEGKAKGPSNFEDGFISWPTIKEWHNNRILEPLLFKTPANVLATAAVREIRNEGLIQDSRDRQILWGPFGSIAEGEKNNDYRFDTIIAGQKIGLTKPEYRIYLLKDHSRKMGQLVKLFEDVECIPGEWRAGDLKFADGVYDVWEEYAAMTGAPRFLEPDIKEEPLA